MSNIKEYCESCCLTFDEVVARAEIVVTKGRRFRKAPGTKGRLLFRLRRA